MAVKGPPKPKVERAIDRHPAPNETLAWRTGEDPQVDAMAASYAAIGAQIKALEIAREVVAEQLREAVGDHCGIATPNVQVGWPAVAGRVEWADLARDEGIPAETIECYRKPAGRSLDVKVVK